MQKLTEKQIAKAKMSWAEYMQSIGLESKPSSGLTFTTNRSYARSRMNHAECYKMHFKEHRRLKKELSKSNNVASKTTKSIKVKISEKLVDRNRIGEVMKGVVLTGFGKTWYDSVRKEKVCYAYFASQHN